MNDQKRRPAAGIGCAFGASDGSHLFPLEKPTDTAAEVLRQIEAMCAQTPPA